MTQNVKTIDGGPLAVPVMSRLDGLILAIPQGYLAPQVLAAGQNAEGIELVGPSREVSSNKTISVLEINCVLVAVVLDPLTEFNPASETQPSLFFSQYPPHCWRRSRHRAHPVLLGSRGGGSEVSLAFSLSDREEESQARLRPKE